MVTSWWLATKPEAYSTLSSLLCRNVISDQESDFVSWHLDLQVDHRLLIRVSLSEALETEHCLIIAAHNVGAMNPLT